MRHATSRGRSLGPRVGSLHLVIPDDTPVGHRAYDSVRHSRLKSGRVTTPCNDVDRISRTCAI
jgi:hypothetical protein